MLDEDRRRTAARRAQIERIDRFGAREWDVVTDTVAWSRLQLAVEQTSEAIIITDLEGTIEYVNPAFEQISGFSREEALG